MTAGMISVCWLVFLGIMLVIEIITMGLTTIWFAGGALGAFVVSMFKGPLWLQFVVFVLISIVLIIFTRPIAVKYMNGNVQKTNVDSLPGKKAVVIKTVDNLHGTGQAVVDGLEWTARTLDGSIIEEGAVVSVVSVEGVKLIVKREMEEEKRDE